MDDLWLGLNKGGRASRLAWCACAIVQLALCQLALAAGSGSAMASAAWSKPSQPAQLGSKQVLILNSYAPGRPGLDAFQTTLISSLVTGGINPENIHVEYLNQNRMVDPAQRQLQQQLLSKQYIGWPFDLVFAVQQPALDYQLHQLKAVAPGAPIFVFNSSGTKVEPVPGRKIVQHLDQLEFKATLDQALALFPATRHVVLTFGTGQADQALKAQLLPLIQADRRNLQFSLTDQMSIEAMYAYLASLPPHSIIISGSVNRDRDGNGIVPFQFTVNAAARANAPLFVLYNTAVGSGVVGGDVIHIERGAARLAGLALDYLSGRMQLTGPLTQVTSPGRPIYDWKQLMRWGAQVDRLPPQAELLNRPPQLWDEHRNTVLATLAVVLAMALLIVAMLMQRARLRQADLRTRASEERYRLLAQELAQHRDHLEELVGERTEALSVAVRLAEQANLAKSAFLANMSHELRTPLTSVIGYSQMMATASHLPQADRNNLAIIHRSGQHLLNLINDILELSKIEAGRNELQLADLDLDPVLRDVLDLVRIKAVRAGTELNLEAPLPVPPVQADGPKLRRVLLNLLSNAVKFAPRGQVTLALAWRRHGDAVVELDFCVRDNGIGIAVADLQRIFEPFVQVDPKARLGGTGLGLTIAREFVRLMGGQLAVRSTPGQGAEFSFTVMAVPVLRATGPEGRAPLADPAASALGASKTTAAPAAGLSVADLLAMPAASRTVLMQAVRELDVYKANKVLAELDPKHAALAAQVQLMLDCYQYQQLWQLLDACAHAAPV